MRKILLMLVVLLSITFDSFSETLEKYDLEAVENFTSTTKSLDEIKNFQEGFDNHYENKINKLKTDQEYTDLVVTVVKPYLLISAYTIVRSMQEEGEWSPLSKDERIQAIESKLKKNYKLDDFMNKLPSLENENKLFLKDILEQFSELGNTNDKNESGMSVTAWVIVAIILFILFLMGGYFLWSYVDEKYGYNIFNMGVLIRGVIAFIALAIAIQLSIKAGIGSSEVLILLGVAFLLLIWNFIATLLSTSIVIALLSTIYQLLAIFIAFKIFSKIVRSFSD